MSSESIQILILFHDCRRRVDSGPGSHFTSIRRKLPLSFPKSYSLSFYSHFVLNSLLVLFISRRIKTLFLMESEQKRNYLNEFFNCLLGSHLYSSSFNIKFTEENESGQIEISKLDHDGNLSRLVLIFNLLTNCISHQI